MDFQKTFKNTFFTTSRLRLYLSPPPFPNGQEYCPNASLTRCSFTPFLPFSFPHMHQRTEAARFGFLTQRTDRPTDRRGALHLHREQNRTEEEIGLRRAAERRSDAPSAVQGARPDERTEGERASDDPVPRLEGEWEGGRGDEQPEPPLALAFHRRRRRSRGRASSVGRKVSTTAEEEEQTTLQHHRHRPRDRHL